jgi:serine/threonine protein kinase
VKVCPTCGKEYPASERFCPSDGTPLRSRDDAEDLIGSVLAERYHILRKLGQGGMGQVYLAEHVRMRRMSAVKVMHPGMVNDTDAISRFNREAANACQILHTNVAAIYDFGETSDGMLYLAMEYIEGEPLTALLRAHGALPPLRAADITRQIADGLGAAHVLGIVHRDLKPDNILVGRSHDGLDRIKVVDFGISRGTQQEGQTVTRTGQVIGTPDFMSPEQLAGDRVDLRSDVYSLGIVTFNMLTGAFPFPSDSVQTSMIMRLTDKPKRLRDMRPDLSWSAEVESVMDRALARDAGLRFQTAIAFSEALTVAIGRNPQAFASSANTTLLDAGATAPSAAPVYVHPFPSPAAPAPTPVGAQHIPAGSLVTPADLSAIETCLARVMGPIASVLVKRAARTAFSRDALVAALAADIEGEPEREKFRKCCPPDVG